MLPAAHARTAGEPEQQEYGGSNATDGGVPLSCAPRDRGPELVEYPEHKKSDYRRCEKPQQAAFEHARIVSD